MKAVYGNNGFWSWLRYWFLDTENWVTFMLLDKGYYDYDFEAVKETVRRKETQEQKDKRTQKMMDRFGFGKVKSVKKPLSAEELQAEVMAEKK